MYYITKDNPDGSKENVMHAFGCITHLGTKACLPQNIESCRHHLFRLCYHTVLSLLLIRGQLQSRSL